MPEWPNGGTPQFRNLRAISPQLRALHPRLRAFQGSRRLISSSDLIIARASVGVAHIDLIEHVIECLPIVHLGRPDRMRAGSSHKARV